MGSFTCPGTFTSPEALTLDGKDLQLLVSQWKDTYFQLPSQMPGAGWESIGHEVSIKLIEPPTYKGTVGGVHTPTTYKQLYIILHDSWRNAKTDIYLNALGGLSWPSRVSRKWQGKSLRWLSCGVSGLLVGMLRSCERFNELFASVIILELVTTCSGVW